MACYVGRMTTKLLSVWILTLMTYLAPPEKIAALPALPGWAETADQRLERYRSIADDIAAVVLDDEEVPVVPGPRGRVVSAALLVAVSYYESLWSPDVDRGPCYRGREGGHRRCDGGASASIFQIHVGTGRTAEGWTRADLFADRKRAVRVALRLLRQSFGACRSAGPDGRLNVYASGRCDAGQALGARRLRLMRRLLGAFPPPAVKPAPLDAGGLAHATAAP